MGNRPGAIFLVAASLVACEASPPPSDPGPPPVPPPPPASAQPKAAPVRQAYAVTAVRERDAVRDADDPDYVRRVREADTQARHALAALEAPHGATPDALAKARAAVRALQGTLEQ